MGQTIHRVEVNGSMFANDNDIEGITIFNASSNKGTITNEKGEFIIAVTIHDVLEISALQFAAQKVTITKEVIESKSLKIYLVSQLNQLDAVILHHGLSGNLATDIANVEIPSKIVIDLGDVNQVELPDYMASNKNGLEKELNELTNPGGFYNGVDFIKLSSMIFKSKKTKIKNNDEPKFVTPLTLIDIYSHKDISETFGIPLDKVEAFMAFVENKDIVQELFDNDHEFERVDFLLKQSELFLILPDDKN